MADDKKPEGGSSDPFADVIWVVFALMIFMYAINGIIAYFGDGSFGRMGWRALTPAGLTIGKTKPISSILNPIGTKVIAIKDKVSLHDSPGGKKIGEMKLGDKGVIIAGPVKISGEKYWKVKFDNGKEGWVNEKDIGAIIQNITPMREIDTLIGTEVETNKEVSLLSSPGGQEIKRLPSGIKGQIIEGPIKKDGKKYWHIKFENGDIGWVEEDSLDSLFGERTPLSEKPNLIGGGVGISQNDTPVYDSPLGNVVFRVNKGTSGKIIEGPLVINGVKYWHIRFDDGREGWVSENNLNYVEDVEPTIFDKIVSFIYKIISFYKVLSVLLTLGFIAFIIYLNKKINYFREEEKNKLYPVEESKTDFVGEEVVKNERWEEILKFIESPNENDWRHAILEADIMLGELLDNLPLNGETMGEKMKSVEKSDFTTIDNAWEAHKVRNNIAHEGGNFRISQREAKRVVDLYRTVFEEFQVI